MRLPLVTLFSACLVWLCWAKLDDCCCCFDREDPTNCCEFASGFVLAKAVVKKEQVELAKSLGQEDKQHTKLGVGEMH